MCIRDSLSDVSDERLLVEGCVSRLDSRLKDFGTLHDVCAVSLVGGLSVGHDELEQIIKDLAANSTSSAETTIEDFLDAFDAFLVADLSELCSVLVHRGQQLLGTSKLLISRSQLIFFCLNLCVGLSNSALNTSLPGSDLRSHKSNSCVRRLHCVS